ncbi:hypothetical protein [Streptomyces parvus]|uniref:hypothetical protein n=1 Tax=Streptomyces parvus TaxID=66428 RepID=UPI0033DE5F6B
MLDYDDEARHYDATWGGEPRARAAADAVERDIAQVTADLRRAYTPRVPDRSARVLDRVAEVHRRLSALPGQDTARPDPRYRLVALTS